MQQKNRFEVGLKYGVACASASQGRVSYPQEVEGWSEVSTPFFVDRILNTNYQWQCFEGCPIQ